MSYDLYFVPEPADGDWDAAMEALEEAAERDEDAPVPPDALAAWERVVPRLREVLPSAEVHGDEASRELDDEATGLQLSVLGEEWSLTVPYWYEGESAQDVVALLRAVVDVVEQETGLVAYDPQTEGPFREGEAGSAEVFDTVAGHLRDLQDEQPEAPKRSFWQRITGR